MKKISMSLTQQVRPVFDIPSRPKPENFILPWQREKVVVIMGATGTGKSRLSVDLAARFPAEVINSDKMQVYKGLDIVTNKITEEEKCGVQHHMLGTINPNSEFTSEKFCDMASLSMESICSRGLLPIIVGGSNSYVEALVGHEDFRFRSKYDCCFIWIDVSLSVLNNSLSQRVDKMVSKGMVDEVRNIFDARANYSRGIRKSIGVPELDKYFRTEKYLDELCRAELLNKSLCNIKINTCDLARRQLEKIRRLRNLKGWNIHRIDATEVLLKRGEDHKADEAWESTVSRRGIAIVRQFLYGVGNIAKTTPSLRALEECNVKECLV